MDRVRVWPGRSALRLEGLRPAARSVAQLGHYRPSLDLLGSKPSSRAPESTRTHLSWNEPPKQLLSSACAGVAICTPRHASPRARSGHRTRTNPVHSTQLPNILANILLRPRVPLFLRSVGSRLVLPSSPPLSDPRPLDHRGRRALAPTRQITDLRNTEGVLSPASLPPPPPPSASPTPDPSTSQTPPT